MTKKETEIESGILSTIRRGIYEFRLPFSLLLYLFVVLVITYPLIRNFPYFLIGDPAGDVWKHVWGLWWIRTCLIDNGILPIYTTLLDFPYGGSFSFIDPLNALISIPLQYVFPINQVYNIIVLFNLSLAFVGCYFLSFDFVKNRYAAFFSGISFAVSSYMMSNIHSGIGEAINIGWMPLFLLFFCKALRTSRPLYAYLAAIAFLFNTLGCWYFGVFGALFAIMYTLYFVCARRHFKARRIIDFLKKPYRCFKDVFASGERREQLKQTAKVTAVFVLFISLRVVIKSLFPDIPRFVSIIVLFLCVITPLLIVASGRFPAFWRNLARQVTRFAVFAAVLVLPPAFVFFSSLGPIVARQRTDNFADTALTPAHKNICVLVDYFLPGEKHAAKSYETDLLTRSYYLGYVTLFLALFALIKVRRRYKWFWGLSALVFMLFSLGPFLYVTEDVCLKKKFFLYMLFYKHFPFFVNVSIPFRFDVCVQLCFALLAGYGLARVLKTRPRSLQARLSIVASQLVLLEMILFSSAPYPIAEAPAFVPKYCYDIARDTAPAGLVNIPFFRENSALVPGEYFYYQSFHHKGMPNRVEGFIPNYVRQNHFLHFLLRIEQGQVDTPRGNPFLYAWIESLKRMKLKYIVVHNSYLSDRNNVKINMFLTAYLGEPQTYPDGVNVYRVYK